MTPEERLALKQEILHEVKQLFASTPHMPITFERPGVPQLRTFVIPPGIDSVTIAIDPEDQGKPLTNCRITAPHGVEISIRSITYDFDGLRVALNGPPPIPVMFQYGFGNV